MSDKKLKILWIIPKWTLPVNDGARVATDSLIRNTINSGAIVDVLCFANGNEKTDISQMKELWGVRNITIEKRALPEKPSKKLIYYCLNFFKSPLTPITFSSFRSNEIINSFKESISLEKYDYILLDGLHLAVPVWESIGQVSFNQAKVIYRAHNIESDLWLKAYREKSNLFLKLILYFQYLLIDKFEKKIIRESFGVAAISKEDLLVIDDLNPKNSKLIPLGLKFNNKLEPVFNDHTKFLFIGRLDWPPNRDGLEWILKEVWPSVMQNNPNRTLKIVGPGNKDWLKAYSHLPGLDVIGLIPKVEDAYRDCQFTIVPVFYGSGTRIKVIESFAMGRKLISTQMGIQGADLESSDFVGAESKEDWIKTLSTIKLDQEMQEALDLSCKKVSMNFNEKEIGQSFYGWLSKLR